MKVQLVLPVAIMTSVALMGVMKLRQKEEDKEDRRKRFQDIKLRVTYDVLQEYEGEKAQQQNLLDKTRSEEKALSEEVIKLQTWADKAKGDVDVCTGEQKSARDELAAHEADLSHLQADNDKEKTSWTAEVDTLQQQLAAPSGVCGFLKTGAPQEVSTLCGKGVEEEEGAKAEAPKPEEPKAEAPKQEEPKAEEPKAEAPKQEEPKAEAPKPEEPKAEAPKQEEPKAEAPKQEEPKAEAPKQEEAKAEAPKKEEAKAEAPKQEEAKAEAPKKEEAKPEAPKQEEAKAEAPKKEEAKPEAPKKR